MGAERGTFTLTLMEPGLDRGRDGVVTARVTRWDDAEGGRRRWAEAVFWLKPYLLRAIEEKLAWLYREEHGEFFAAEQDPPADDD